MKYGSISTTAPRVIDNVMPKATIPIRVKINPELEIKAVFAALRYILTQLHSI